MSISPVPVATASPANQHPLSAAAGIIVVSAVIGALYFGRDILIPIALSVLLSFALAPLVRRMQRLAVPRVAAVLLAVLLTFAGIGAFGVVVGGQIVRLAENLPDYQANILTKLGSLHELSPSGGLFDRASRMVEEVTAQLPTVGAGGSPAAETVTVQVQDAPATPLEVLKSVALPLLAPIGTAGVVIVFVVFMLLEREDLRDRLIRLFGGGDLQHSTHALNEAALRVSRYLLTQLLVNSAYGIPIGIGLWFIGVPNALLWGVLATVLRFVPYVGPFIAALFPIALAFAVDPGWTMLFWTVALILTAELVSNCIVEPRLYGSSTGISTVAILAAAVFWTALWGPIGLLLSTPLTVCLAVLGRHVPQLRFLDVMLGSDPVLSPPERLYQRMLSGDVDEGEELARKILRNRPVASFHDEVGLPALRLAEADRASKRLTPDLHARVAATFAKVIAELADHDGPDLDEDESETRPDIVWSGKSVLCVAGRSGLDRAAACMLAQLLERRGIGARLLPADAISPEGIASLDLEGVELVCLVFLNASAVAHARQAAKRIRRRNSAAQILICLWNQQSQVHEADGGAPESPDSMQADFVEHSMVGAAKRVEALATKPIGSEMVPAPVPENEDVRLAALKDLNLLDTPPEERFDRFTRKLAKVFNAPISLVSLIDEDRQFWKSATGVADGICEAPRKTSICGHVVAANDVIVIEDVMKDKRFANNAWLKERGIRFYAGAPLQSPSGSAIGSVCVIDTEPRKISDRDKAFLEFVAEEVMEEVARGSERARVREVVAAQ